jgi:hypothetical protein
MDTKPCSYAWRGPRGSGKKTQLHAFLENQAKKADIPFQIKTSTWYLKSTLAGGDPDDDNDEDAGKNIPYEESAIHLGYDVARMSMSDKVFLQSILTRWTGQRDVCLLQRQICTRYLVLYHAHYLTDESVLQLQECLEQYPTFAILLTTELPLCPRLRDFCLEIPVAGEDRVLDKFSEISLLPKEDVWLVFFKKTLYEWMTPWKPSRVADIRNWIYICLQRNLRWTDVILYWIETIYTVPELSDSVRSELLRILSTAESGAGWVLITSYRIPIIWEHIHLQFALILSKCSTN